MGFARGLGDSAAAAAGAFLSGQKGTKEPSKERGISISPSPLKTSPLKTTNQGGLRSPLLDVPPWGRRAGVVAPHAVPLPYPPGEFHKGGRGPLLVAFKGIGFLGKGGNAKVPLSLSGALPTLPPWAK